MFTDRRQLQFIVILLRVLHVKLVKTTQPACCNWGYWKQSCKSELKKVGFWVFSTGREEKKRVKCLKDGCNDLNSLFIVQYFRKQG